MFVGENSSGHGNVQLLPPSIPLSRVVAGATRSLLAGVVCCSGRQLRTCPLGPCKLSFDLN